MSENIPPAADPNGFESYAGRPASSQLITSATAVTMNFDRPFATQRVEATATSEDELKASYRLLSPELKRAISAKLKGAGYKVPITDRFDLSVRDAWVEANKQFSDFAAEQMRIDPEFFTDKPFTVDDFLSMQNQGTTGGKTKTYTTVYSEEKAGALVDTIFKDLTGMPASEDDKIKYTAILRSAQAANPSTYNASTGYAEEGMGAAEAQKMLIDEIAGTDEAKRMRAMNGYQILLTQLGVKI